MSVCHNFVGLECRTHVAFVFPASGRQAHQATVSSSTSGLGVVRHIIATFGQVVAVEQPTCHSSRRIFRTYTLATIALLHSAQPRPAAPPPPPCTHTYSIPAAGTLPAPCPARRASPESSSVASTCIIWNPGRGSWRLPPLASCTSYN